MVSADRPYGRRLDGTPLGVSPFTLGTMRALGSPSQMEAVLREALVCGVNHLETAPAYGPAERFLGQALQRLASEGLAPDGGWRITSKLLPGCDLASGQQQLRGILERLAVGQLSHLAVHGINRSEHLEWALRGPGAALLSWAQDSGLVLAVGFTSHGSNALIARALESGRFSFCGLHVHLLDRTRLSLARTALAAGIGVLAISPADKGGRLYDPPAELIEDCKPLHPLELAYRFLLEQGLSSLSLGAAQPSDLAWVARLSGPEQAAEVAAAVIRLDAAQTKRLGSEHCGQCRACLPCPNGVPIPELLRLRNLALGHGMHAFAQERYNLIGRAGHWWEELNAEACQRCGDCLPRCPRALPIPELLADTHQRLAAAPRRRLWG